MSSQAERCAIYDDFLVLNVNIISSYKRSAYSNSIAIPVVLNWWKRSRSLNCSLNVCGTN